MIPKNRGEGYPKGFLHSEFFLSRVEPLSANPLNVALGPGHSDKTRFRQWSSIETGNHLYRAEIIPNVAQTTGNVDVFDSR